MKQPRSLSRREHKTAANTTSARLQQTLRAETDLNGETRKKDVHAFASTRPVSEQVITQIGTHLRNSSNREILHELRGFRLPDQWNKNNPHEKHLF